MTGANRRKSTLADLRAVQRLAGAVIMRPLSSGWHMQRRWIDGRDMRDVASEFIKPNDRLAAYERLEIYNRQYWFRLVDCLYDDFPGLLAVLGKPRFNRLILAYLQKHPSRSYALRDLAEKMPEFLWKNPNLAGLRPRLAQDMATLEWAQAVAFDGPARPALTVDDLLGQNPARLRLALQPYITLLDLQYPLDDYLPNLKRHQSAPASNAMSEANPAAKKPSRRPPLPRLRRVFIAVHRHDNTVYYKRLEPGAYQLLSSLRAGKTLGAAMNRLTDLPEPEKISAWFRGWAELGWFCKRGTKVV